MTYSLVKEIADIIDSLHKTPSYEDTGHPMVRVVDVKYGALNLSNTKKVNEAVYSEFSRRYTPEIDDIVITRVGSYGISALVKNTHFCLGQNTAAIKPKIDKHYFFYALNSPALQQEIEYSTVGSTQKTLSLKAIGNLKIPRFDERAEKKIGKILSVLDDKIGNNRRMNETLEEMARALFKSWFVDFDPVHAKAAGNAPAHMDDETATLFPSSFGDDGLPVGWENSIIGDEVEIFGGGTPSTKEPIYWEGGEFNWCTPKDLSPLVSPVLLSTSRKITERGLKKISSGLLPTGTLLMSSRAPVGYLAIPQIPVAVNQGFIAMKCSKRLSNLYVLFWCEQNMEKIKNNAGGSTFAEISKRNFKPIPIICPNEKVVAAFDSYVEPIFAKVVLNLKENQTLAELRDTLLPKLMSGEIRVSDAEREVEAAV
jgi:type I restriction enzyme, S subunit